MRRFSDSRSSGPVLVSGTTNEADCSDAWLAGVRPCGYCGSSAETVPDIPILDTYMCPSVKFCFSSCYIPTLLLSFFELDIDSLKRHHGYGYGPRHNDHVPRDNNGNVHGHDVFVYVHVTWRYAHVHEHGGYGHDVLHLFQNTAFLCTVDTRYPRAVCGDLHLHHRAGRDTAGASGFETDSGGPCVDG